MHYSYPRHILQPEAQRRIGYHCALLTISSLPEEKDADNRTVTTPTGTKLTGMQPMDTDSEVMIPPAYSNQQLIEEAENGDEGKSDSDASDDNQNARTRTEDGEEADYDDRDVFIYIYLT